MSNHDHYIEEDSLSIAWARALRLATEPGVTEVAPITISITGFDAEGGVHETPAIRAALDEVLRGWDVKGKRKQTVDTVANTIFPASLWNPEAPREQLFDRYRRIFSRIQHSSAANRRGIYFERMINGGPTNNENQLEHVISLYRNNPSIRRSALQVATFDPRRDHLKTPRLGFPCLQHVTFARTNGKLSVNAFYATQFLVERAYGNYLGLSGLGRFVAHELGLPLGRLTVLVGVARCDAPKTKLNTIFAALNASVPPTEENSDAT